MRGNEKMNLLMCSVGRRGELLKDFRKTMGTTGKIVATDNSQYAPALYFADRQYIVPKIKEPDYIDILLDICKKEDIQAIATFIDPEIEVLSKNREVFETLGIKVLVPYYETAKLCFNKYDMFKHMWANGIPTVQTYGTLEEAQNAIEKNKLSFPVFVKPRTGSGSVGARKVNNLEELVSAMRDDESLIIQEFMDGIDLDADVYVDTQSRQVVSAFSKRKISTTIGGANKTISFKDKELFSLIHKIADVLELYGPNDMDFFYKDGQYYLSEINPRFGGAYLHAYGAGVDFIKLIEQNLKGKVNTPHFGDYEDGVVMMMYDSVVIKGQAELAE
jgi:carbamoyl-phosphate synthase large subunit